LLVVCHGRWPRHATSTATVSGFLAGNDVRKCPTIREPRIDHRHDHGRRLRVAEERRHRGGRDVHQASPYQPLPQRATDAAVMLYAMPMQVGGDRRDEVAGQPVDGKRLPVGIDEADPAARTGHPDQLGNDRVRVGDVLQNPLGPGPVERGVRQVKGGEITRDIPDGLPSCRDAAAATVATEGSWASTSPVGPTSAARLRATSPRP
jgi:hypothetical protein